MASAAIKSCRPLRRLGSPRNENLRLTVGHGRLASLRRRWDGIPPHVGTYTDLSYNEITVILSKHRNPAGNPKSALGEMNKRIST